MPSISKRIEVFVSAVKQLLKSLENVFQVPLNATVCAASSSRLDLRRNGAASPNSFISNSLDMMINPPLLYSLKKKKSRYLKRRQIFFGYTYNSIIKSN